MDDKSVVLLEEPREADVDVARSLGVGSRILSAGYH